MQLMFENWVQFFNKSFQSHFNAQNPIPLKQEHKILIMQIFKALIHMVKFMFRQISITNDEISLKNQMRYLDIFKELNLCFKILYVSNGKFEEY